MLFYGLPEKRQYYPTRRDGAGDEPGWDQVARLGSDEARKAISAGRTLRWATINQRYALRVTRLRAQQLVDGLPPADQAHLAIDQHLGCERARVVVARHAGAVSARVVKHQEVADASLGQLARRETPPASCVNTSPDSQSGPATTSAASRGFAAPARGRNEDSW